MVFIEKEAKNLQPYVAPRHYTASARAAMIHILAAKKRLDPRGILLPAYIGLSKIEGSGVFDPIRTTGIPHAFYRVDTRLRPDVDALEAQLKTGQYQLVFLIHYFGVPQVDVERFTALCHRYGVQIIEDCAHTLLGGLGGKRLGTYGDYAIFSVHKSIAAEDGGFFLDNRGELADVLLDAASCISARTLATLASTDVLAASEQRLRNYERVAGWVRDLPGVELLFERIPEHAVPLNCPVIVLDGKREALYFALIEAGVLPTALYHTLIPEISHTQFADSAYVSSNILNLPTHPDIAQDDFARYEAVLNAAIHEVVSA
ncbi:DegT/DnrJ/EryC1/StrS aminotransferase family protein [Paraburkholderia fungorum]|uniref:DegT/DnrJ/EryC1/StrS aminotransferase family protein n=1 Tax=Paraburkholderia fungorum TaxID=134537 RepID=A0A1H0YM84_9BURK|nr:DegT/DnrJ/EryC1/StrS family aminotransferase [Paraburkholderia fungorum]SDQ16337.1 DegT/DnrJ/EryC1/StrS aminotransferase family protein [Paraburkholderia fungorum]